MIIGPCVSECWIIRNDDGIQISQNRVVFTDRDDRIDRFNCFPDPVVIAVNVNTQQSNFTRESAVIEYLVDVFPRNKETLGLQSMSPRQSTIANLRFKLRVGIDDQTAPISVFQKESRIRFVIQFHTELDETVQMIGNLRSFDNPVYDSILTELRQNLKFHVPQRPDGLF